MRYTLLLLVEHKMEQLREIKSFFLPLFLVVLKQI